MTLSSVTSTAALPHGVSIEYVVHGDLSNPIVFVVLGITDNITDWPDGLFKGLVDAGYCVVVHELRDSGHSSKFDQLGKADLTGAKARLECGDLPSAGYTAADVANDASVLMDYLHLSPACVVGYSYGALVAQILTLEHPEKVKALVCLQGSNYDPELPPRSPAVDQAMSAALVSYASVDEQIQAMQRLRLATNGSSHAFNEVEAFSSAKTSVERMYYPEGTARIVLSRLATAPIHQRIQGIECPCLVLHADEDPIFPIEHGENLANRIPGAQLIVLTGAGHNHPPSLQPEIVRHLVVFLDQLK